MKIVIDTNIIHGDFYLRNAQIISLCETSKICGIRVLVPEIVIDEVINHYREKIDEANKDLEKAKKGISFFYPMESVRDYFSPTNTDQLLKDYRNALFKRLDELNITIIPYPNISHKELVKRDLARKKPFQPSGKGYRDALIWESVCNNIEKTDNNPDVVFINKNTKDFFEKGNIHPDLQTDVEKKGLSHECIVIYEDISKAIDEYIKPRQSKRDDLIAKYSGKDCIGEIDIKSYIRNEVKLDIFDSYIKNIPYFQIGKGRYLENIDIYAISDSKCNITDIRFINDSQLIIDIEAVVLLDYFAYLHKADSFLLDDMEMPNIINHNFNRHYMEVQDSINMPVKVSLIVDKDLKTVDSYSITYQ